MPVIVDLYMGIVRSEPDVPEFCGGRVKQRIRTFIPDRAERSEKIQPILRLRRQIEEEMDKGLLRKMPVIDLVSTLVSLVVFRC